MYKSELTRGCYVVTVATAACMLVAAPVAAQSRADFEGVWSTTATLPDDPEWLSEDYFCFWGCTVGQYEHFGDLLDDPANDDRPVEALSGEASGVGSADFRNALVPSLQADWDSEPVRNSVCLSHTMNDSTGERYGKEARRRHLA